MRITRSPSKFGGGIGLLWRGTNLTTLNEGLRGAIGFLSATRGEDKSERFLFESARSALFHALAALGVGPGAEVVVCAFTCDAVTYAVQRTGAEVVYVDINDDLTMNAAAVMAAMTDKTSAVIVQNTLGRLGLEPATIEQIRLRGVLVIEDCALSIGSCLGDFPHGSFGDISIWSLEVSKTLTVGWGGVLTVNTQEHLESIRQHYDRLQRVPFWLDLLRVTQLWVSVFLTAHPPPLGVYLWYFLYGTRLFRGSSHSQRDYFCTHARLGAMSAALFHSLEARAGDLFRKTNVNYMTLLAEAKGIGLRCPVTPEKGEFLVSPRFSLIVAAGSRDALTRTAAAAGIELGHWFDQAPPPYGLERSRVSSSANAHRISGLIVNLPCHWSISCDEIETIRKWMRTIAA